MVEQNSSLFPIRLSALNPTLHEEAGILVFDCPKCTGDNVHRIRVALDPPAKNPKPWKRTGAFPDTLTLTPSINAGCWHGYVTNGEIVNC